MGLLLVCLDQMLHLCHTEEMHKSGLRLQVCVCVFMLLCQTYRVWPC